MMPVPETLVVVACVGFALAVYLLAAWAGGGDGGEYLE